MKYTEKKTLATRGPVDPGPPAPVDGTLLVGEPIAKWEDGHRETGHDVVRLMPAFHNGARVWLIRRAWCPAHGYCAAGTEEQILSFKEGVRLLLERGAFNHLFAEE
jgi:hypothetical protein